MAGVHSGCRYNVRFRVKAGSDKPRSFNKHLLVSIISYRLSNKPKLGLVQRHLQLIEKLLYNLVKLVSTLIGQKKV